ncbi:single-strand DNA-binding protein [Mumia flava]|uniref:Single-strand DNA-binding protein n=1 Tax=Mumia flava TaxID=1348852 RepID=A0A2M9B8C8_9ACTN|nr:single-stranded DNA-binding protein [Mumia flava]PJJ54190.1 single-strand DNA-binding protein [Mumia flava]
MSDNTMTVYGHVGTEVDFRESNAFCWAMFRVGSTPRYFDRKQGIWRDLETVWITVKATRTLAENVKASLTVGEPVVVIGRIRTHTWQDPTTRETQRRDVLEATAVCHDLNRGTTTFRRNEQPAATEATASEGEVVRAFEASQGEQAPTTGESRQPVSA